MLNRQEVFNTVKNHLLTQGRRSTSQDGIRCRYRGADGAMCAIGPLIKDEFYSKDLEGLGPDTVSVIQALCLSLGIKGITRRDEHFLCHLQEVHDMGNVEDWPEELQRCANEWGLNYD